MLCWQVSSWWLEHPEHGFFTVHVRPDGTASASRIVGREVERLVAADPVDPREPSLHRSSALAILTCERRIDELSRVAVAAPRPCPLRLVVP